LVLSLLVVLAASSTARAQNERDQSRAHFVEGTRFYKAGDYDHAIAEYEAAYKILPIPEILFNLGQAYRLKGNKQKAIDLYNRYLLISPSGRVAEEAKSDVAQLQVEMEQDRARARAAAEAAARAAAEKRAAEKAAAEKAAAEKAAAEKAAAEKAAAEKAAAARAAEERAANERAAAASAPAIVAQPTTAPARPPLYKRWWLWTAAGGAAAVVLGVGLGVGLSRAPGAPNVTTSDGTLHPF
jgi:hypothetical protein